MRPSTLRTAALCLSLALVATGASAWWWGGDDEAAAEPVTEITWEDLVPSDYAAPEDPFMTMSMDEINEIMDGSDESNRRLAEIEESMSYAPTVAELDGRRVRLPGFVVPLDFDGQTRVEEFLVVPYYGACIHTPPPPGNQVVHALSGKPVELQSLYDPVWAIGTIRVEETKSDLAEAGYTMRVERVEPYEAPADAD